jgi:murein DD-endopeptidase MepM/ murein hydrolase activator NlpD
VAHEGLRIISFRGLLYKGLMAAAGVAALAFGGGLWAGMTLSQRAESGAEPDAVAAAAQDPVKEKMGVAKFGELSARLKQLQVNANLLLKSVGTQEEVVRKLRAIDPRLAPNGLPPEPKKHSAEGGGGPLLPPSNCSGKPDAIGSRLLIPADLQQTENSIDCLHVLLNQIQALVSARDANLMAVPSGRPVDDGKIGSSFGNRVDPFTSRLALHSGLDFPAPSGTPIYSAAGGKVIFAGPHAGYGRMVAIDHGNGFVTRYAHASKIHVDVDDVVMPRQLIADVGSSGRSTGPHLHFEVLYRSQFLDPKDFLLLGNMEVETDELALD